MKKARWRLLHPRFWLSWLGLFLMRLTICFPTRIQLLLGNTVAVLMRPAMKKRRAIAVRNLELCFPELTDGQRRQLLAKNLEMMGMMMVETALSWWASSASLKHRVHYHGLAYLDEALAKGKGVILLTGHFTSMELGGRLIMLKYPCYVMLRQLKNPLFNQVMMAARSHHSEGVVLKDDPRSMIKALKQNKVVWYAPDQDFTSKFSVFARFFGVTASTLTATARLAKISSAAVIPFVPRRNDDGSYTLSLSAPLDNFPTGDDIIDAQTINDLIEREVRKAPEQYLWIHRRFKTQANSKKGVLYKKSA